MANQLFNQLPEPPTHAFGPAPRMPPSTNYLTPEEIISRNYLEGIDQEPKRTARVPVWDDYRIKSKINNLPRTISCNSDLCIHHRLLKSLFSIPQLLTLFNLIDYLFIALIVGLTVLFVELNVVYQPDVGTLIALILFPLTYAMGNSFSRRADTLSKLASIRATGINILLTVCQINAGPGSQDNSQSYPMARRHQTAQTIILRLREHFKDCQRYALSHHESDRLFYRQQIYCRLNQINWCIGEFVKGEGEPVIERLGGQLITLVETFEQFRSGIDYQASTSVEYFLRALIVINTIFLTPWFAGFIKSSENATVFGYFLTGSIIASLIGLYRIQIRLENPIGSDWDDINIQSMLSSDLVQEQYRLTGDQGVDRQRMRLFLGRDDYDPQMIVGQRAAFRVTADT
jgi:hypothetical protein